MKSRLATAMIGLRSKSPEDRKSDRWAWVWAPPFVVLMAGVALFVFLSPLWVGGTLVVRAWQRTWAWDPVFAAAAAGFAWLVLLRVHGGWNGPSWLRRLQSIAGWTYLAMLPIASLVMLGQHVGLVPIGLACAGVLWKAFTTPADHANAAAGAPTRGAERTTRS